MESSVESVIEYEFDDRALLAAATSTSSRSFGALEHLGDAVADLAVAVTSWRAGLGSADAAAFVANKNLDAQFHGLLDGLVHGTSGDVIEAIVGAVHLDGGFDAAARVAVRLCIPTLAWIPLGTSSEGNRIPPRWIGTIAIDAAITDHAVGAEGIDRTSQKRLNDFRVRAVNHVAMRSAVDSWLAAEGIDEPQPMGWFQKRVASTLFHSGWRSAADLVVTVLLR